MNRRDFLKKAFKHTFVAGGTATAMYGASRVWRPLEGLSIEEKKQDLPPEEDEKLAVSNFMEKYEIPDIELAQDLYERTKTELALYFAGGATTASLYRSVDYDQSTQEKRSFLVRGGHFFAATGLGFGLSYPAKYAMGALQDDSLLKSDTLIFDYQMPREKAEQFVEDYKERLSDTAYNGGVCASMVQGWLGVFPVFTDNYREPPKPQTPSNPQTTLEA